MMGRFTLQNAQTTLMWSEVVVKTQSMFTEPEAKKDANEGGTRKTTATEGQLPASQGAEGKAQGT